MICSATFQKLGPLIQGAIPNDSKIKVETNGCLPLFLFFRHKSCVGTISGVDAPTLLTYISNNIPDKKKKEED